MTWHADVACRRGMPMRHADEALAAGDSGTCLSSRCADASPPASRVCRRGTRPPNPHMHPPSLPIHPAWRRWWVSGVWQPGSSWAAPPPSTWWSLVLGRGTLMADLLRGTAAFQQFSQVGGWCQWYCSATIPWRAECEGGSIQLGTMRPASCLDSHHGSGRATPSRMLSTSTSTLCFPPCRRCG